MREQTRILPFLLEVQQIWYEYFPDWRFGQMMINFNNWHIAIYGNDIFYLEEGTFLNRLKEYVNMDDWKKEEME